MEQYRTLMLKPLMYKSPSVVLLNYFQKLTSAPVDPYPNWYGKIERHIKGFRSLLLGRFNWDSCRHRLACVLVPILLTPHVLVYFKYHFYRFEIAINHLSVRMLLTYCFLIYL